MNYVPKLIRSVDILDYKYNLTYKGKRGFKTIFGGLMSILVTTLFSLGFVYFGRELIQKKNPVVVQSEKFYEDSKISFKKLGFHFGLMNLDGTYEHLSEDFMKSIQMQASMINFEAVEGNVIPIPEGLFIEACREEFFEPEIWEERAKAINMTNLLCINPNKVYKNGQIIEEEQFIYNDWSTLGARGLWINIKMCNTKEKPGCNEWILKNKDFFFMGSMANYYFDPTDYENPIKHGFKNSNTLVGINLSFIDVTSIIKKTAFLDSGWIVEVKSEESFHSYGVKEMSIQTFDPENPNLYDYSLHCPRTQTEYSRRYTKLQEIIADLGGMIKMIVLVLGGLSKIVGEYYFLAEFETAKGEKLPSKLKVSFFKSFRHKIPSEDSEVREKTDATVRKMPRIGVETQTFWSFARWKLFSKKPTQQISLCRQYFDVDYYISRFIQLEKVEKRLESTEEN